MARIGQEGLNNFLTDHLLRFLLGCGVRAPGSAQKRHLEARLDLRFPANVQHAGPAAALQKKKRTPCVTAKRSQQTSIFPLLFLANSPPEHLTPPLKWRS